MSINKYTEEVSMRGNCFIYAVKMKLRYGGYIVPKLTKWNRVPFLKWPHFFWLPPGQYPFQSYVPLGEKRVRVLPPPFFRGRIVHGDEESQ